MDAIVTWLIRNIMQKKRIIIGMTGASGIIYGIRLLETLRNLDIETDLVVSKAAHQTRAQETSLSAKALYALSARHYHVEDIGASIASGSCRTQGMIIAPCSMRTLADIANGTSSNLITRAADVVLKERRKLVLMVRETPLHLGHLLNMTRVTEMGGIIAPPVPAFYPMPKSLDELVNHNIGRILDLYDIENELVKRWKEI